MRAPLILRLGGRRLRVSPVFDTYWRLAAERQAIFFRRLEGGAPPWTDDPILQRHKFTNAYRASDRVSQYLIAEVIYRGSQEPTEVVFRTLLFKLFNRIETWELLLEAFGQPTWSAFEFDRYDRVLMGALIRGEPIYSAAYIIPPPRFGCPRKHQNHLRLIERMLADRLADRLLEAAGMRAVYELIRRYPSMGDFLAYQLATDINYSELLRFSEMEFVVAGPGARDGLRKCFQNDPALAEEDVIRLVADTAGEHFERLGLRFRDLWGRGLQLIDCQNLFCEVDKYARVAHPEVRGRSGRSRIKQVFRATPKPIDYRYPPSWGLPNRVSVQPRPAVPDGQFRRTER